MKTIGEKAAEYLESKNFDGVMHGDCSLLHEIAEYCGIKHRSWKTEKQILDAIDRCNLFRKSYDYHRGRTIRSFFIIKSRNDNPAGLNSVQ